MYEKKLMGEFGYIFRGRNSVKNVLPPSEKGSTLNGKNLLPGEQILSF